jgi:hypothetical protein
MLLDAPRELSLRPMDYVCGSKLTISRLFCGQIGEFRASPKGQRQLRRLTNVAEAVLSHAVEESDK